MADLQEIIRAKRAKGISDMQIKNDLSLSHSPEDIDHAFEVISKDVQKEDKKMPRFAIIFSLLLLVGAAIAVLLFFVGDDNPEATKTPVQAESLDQLCIRRASYAGYVAVFEDDIGHCNDAAEESEQEYCKVFYSIISGLKKSDTEYCENVAVQDDESALYKRLCQDLITGVTDCGSSSWHSSEEDWVLNSYCKAFLQGDTAACNPFKEKDMLDHYMECKEESIFIRAVKNSDQFICDELTDSSADTIAACKSMVTGESDNYFSELQNLCVND